MKRLFAVALGILTAIGGFVDIGDLVTNAAVGSRFGLSLVWVVVVGVLGICVFAEMSGRVAAVSGRATFDLIRERLGPRVGLADLVGSMAVTFLTLTAEIGGVALALELATSINYLLWVPVVGVLVWVVLWRVRFAVLENVFGLAGLALIVFAVAVWKLGPDWGALVTEATRPAVPGDGGLDHLLVLRGRAVRRGDDALRGVLLLLRRRRGEVGRRAACAPCAPTCSSASRSAGCCRSRSPPRAAIVLRPQGIEVASLGQVGAAGASRRSGKLGLVLVLVGFFAATFGAACETGLSVGYSVAQYFGWQWGKFVEPLRAARFHTVVLLSCVAGVGILLDHGRPHPGHRVLGRVQRPRPAADLLPDPRRRQRPHLHGAARQRPRSPTSSAPSTSSSWSWRRSRRYPLMVLTGAGS